MELEEVSLSSTALRGCDTGELENIPKVQNALLPDSTWAGSKAACSKICLLHSVLEMKSENAPPSLIDHHLAIARKWLTLSPSPAAWPDLSPSAFLSAMAFTGTSMPSKVAKRILQRSLRGSDYLNQLLRPFKTVNADLAGGMRKPLRR